MGSKSSKSAKDEQQQQSQQQQQQKTHKGEDLHILDGVLNKAEISSCPAANPRVASAQAMATAVVKRPISQRSTPPTMPPPPPLALVKDQSHMPPPIPPSNDQTQATGESGSEYAHYNSKLTIENFDLLKVNKKSWWLRHCFSFLFNQSDHCM